MNKLLLCLFLLITARSFSQSDDSLFIRSIATEVLVNGRAYDNLRELTKTIGGRLAGSKQMVPAEKWGSRALHQAGADTCWLQECMVPRWVRGGPEEVTVSAGATSKSLHVLGLGNSIGTGSQPIASDLVLVSSFDDLDAKKDSVKDKIVFYNYPFNPQFIETFNSYVDAVPYRVAGPSKAAKYGARAVLIRSISHSTDNYPHTGTLIYDSTINKIPALAMGLKDADWLADEMKHHRVSARIKTNAHFLPDTVGHNVIGELKGSEYPDQFITVGGHLDSWDPAEGANDDGAGVVQTIEILRALRAVGYHPRHTIRFVLFANEENGLRGAKKYADEAVAHHEQHIFGLESDAGGFTPRGFGFDASAAEFEKINRWKDLLAPYGGDKLTTGGGGADVGPLHKLMNTPVAELRPDSQRYFDYHHAANDVFENVNKRELELGAINMAALIYLIDKYGL